MEESGENTRLAAGNLYNTMEEEYLSWDDSALLIEYHRHASYDTLTLFVGPIDRGQRTEDRRQSRLEYRISNME